LKKVTQKINGKINLTLDVLGVKDGYHIINSLVASVKITDAVTLYKRNDDKITLIEKGVKVGGKITDNNAYKSAKAFMEYYKTNGVDIVINKKIPIGSGLGGSSADIAGVLKGMATIYGAKDGVDMLAEKLGSDVNYMLRGGYATISGRGENVALISSKDKFYLILKTEDFSVTAKESYSKYDQVVNNIFNEQGCTSICAKALMTGESKKLFENAKNDLYLSSKLIKPEIETSVNLLKEFNADYVSMTGSGATTYALYLTKKARNKAYKELIKRYGKEKFIKTKTV